jgi:beta-glucosidase
LDLIGRQNELVDAIAATGKPIVALLFNGAPLAIQPLERSAQAIFECWYLGQETGRAVADVLFGDFNPGGKLPITIPRSAGHLPATSRWLAADTCSTTFLRCTRSATA